MEIDFNIRDNRQTWAVDTATPGLRRARNDGDYHSCLDEVGYQEHCVRGAYLAVLKTGWGMLD